MEITKVLARNVEKNTLTIYDVPKDIDYKSYICKREDSGIEDMVFEQLSEKDAYELEIRREYYITFGSSHQYSWMGKHKAQDVALSILATTLEEARVWAFKQLATAWSTSYNNRPDYVTVVLTTDDVLNNK